MIASAAAASIADLPPEMREFLRELALGDSVVAARPLTGGVSSDIWLLETPRERLCIKRALPALRVAADWQAPIERSTYEYAWIERVQAILPNAVPKLLGRSTSGAMFAMAFLDPRDHPLWKDALLRGDIDPRFAGHEAPLRRHCEDPGLDPVDEAIQGQKVQSLSVCFWIASLRSQ